MNPDDMDCTSDKNCPKCGRLADHRLPAVAWNRCNHCRLYFDDEGNDMDEFSRNLMQEIFVRRDEFLNKLLFHARNYLADEHAEHPVKQFLNNLELGDEEHSLSSIALFNLTLRTRDYQQTQRPSLDPQEELDPFAFFDRLSQVFVIDFVAECQRFLDSLSPVNRHLAMNGSLLSKNGMHAYQLMKLFREHP